MGRPRKTATPVSQASRGQRNASTRPADVKDVAKRLKRTSIEDLSEINGIKPKNPSLLDGSERLWISHDGGKNDAIRIRYNGDHFYCSCPGWGYATGYPNQRTCRHLISMLGGAYEEARLELADELRQANKRKEPESGEGEDEDEDEQPPKKKSPSTNRKTKTKATPVEVESSESDSNRDEVKKEDEEDEEDEVKDEDEDVEMDPGEEEDEAEVDAPKRSKPRTSTRKKVSVLDKQAKAATFKPLLAHKWDLDDGCDPTGWHISEKLDGVRAIWHGDKGTFLSREGNPFYAPDWFTKKFPKGITLDGELFTERGDFQQCVSIVRAHNKPEKWKFSVSYQIFDVPSLGDRPFEERMDWIKKRFSGKNTVRWVNVLSHEKCRGRDHVLEKLDEICDLKGEGLMLREPKSLYVEGRSRTLLKVKKFFDADAIVRGHERGSGKNANCTGALRVEMLDGDGEPTGKMFKIGSGLTDKQRQKPPKIGSVVIYKYQQLSNSGTPRFPTYVGERAD